MSEQPIRVFMVDDHHCRSQGLSGAPEDVLRAIEQAHCGESVLCPGYCADGSCRS